MDIRRGMFFQSKGKDYTLTHQLGRDPHRASGLFVGNALRRSCIHGSSGGGSGKVSSRSPLDLHTAQVKHPQEHPSTATAP
eukprot:2972383-Amphidinium_carterae.2